jgi:predicted membrane protein (TIGR00267 family)
LRDLLKRSWRVLAGLALRRYFVNTIFDSTFVAMGIVIGASLAPETSVRTVVSTMLATSVALGISTGTSVYEAEKVEADIRLRELERAMLTELSGTEAKKALDLSRYLVVFVNVLAPPVVFGLTSAPFLLAGSLFVNAFPAALISIVISISILFAVGAYLGRLSGGSSWLKGLRMALLGLGTFAAIWFVQGLIS